MPLHIFQISTSNEYFYNRAALRFAPSSVSVFFLSTGIVALAEMDDKTQLLSLLLAARFRKPWPIALGIFAATLANHALAGALGAWVTTQLAPEALRWALGLSFIMMAGWMMAPDQLDDDQQPARAAHWGVFGATLAVFFMAEMGDKTQLGMMLANAPVVCFGERLMKKLPLRAVHLACAAIFAALGLAALLGWRMGLG